MNKKLSKQELLLIAQQRLNQFDWELPVSAEEIDALHASLPKRWADEAIPDWLRRVLIKPSNAIYELIAMPQKYYAVSYITRRAAADGKPSKKEITLESDDSMFRLTIELLADHFHVKAEALGMAIEEFVDRQLEITCNALNGAYKIVIQLDATMAEGEIDVEDNADSRLLLLDTDTRIILRIL